MAAVIRDDFDELTLSNHAVEDLEPEYLDHLSAHAVNAGQLCPLRMPPNEFHRRIDCRHDIHGAAGTARAQIFIDGNQIVGDAPTTTNPHRTPQRFQKDRINSSLTHLP